MYTITKLGVFLLDVTYMLHFTWYYFYTCYTHPQNELKCFYFFYFQHFRFLYVLKDKFQQTSTSAWSRSWFVSPLLTRHIARRMGKGNCFHFWEDKCILPIWTTLCCIYIRWTYMANGNLYFPTSAFIVYAPMDQLLWNKFT